MMPLNGGSLRHGVQFCAFLHFTLVGVWISASGMSSLMTGFICFVPFGAEAKNASWESDAVALENISITEKLKKITIVLRN